MLNFKIVAMGNRKTSRDDVETSEMPPDIRGPIMGFSIGFIASIVDSATLDRIRRSYATPMGRDFDIIASSKRDATFFE